MPSQDAAEEARLEALELMKASDEALSMQRACRADFDRAFQPLQQKDTLEKELMELHSNLQNQNAELGQSLIDDEGFPRADIDVYSVRLSRV